MVDVTLKGLNDIAQRMPFNKTLGIRVTRLHKDGITIECPLRPDLLNLMGVLHGGVTATMADAVVGISIWRHHGGTRSHTTVEMKLNYLAPVTPGKGAKIVARSYLVRVGQHLAIGRVELFDGKRKIVGIAIVTYMLL